MYATSPHAASQLKHVVGTSMYRFSTFLGHAVDSYSAQSSHSAMGGKDSRGVTFMEGGSLIDSSRKRRQLPRPYVGPLVTAQPHQHRNDGHSREEHADGRAPKQQDEP